MIPQTISAFGVPTASELHPYINSLLTPDPIVPQVVGRKAHDRTEFPPWTLPN